MQRLWDEERAGGSNALQVTTLERLGGARHIVEEHLQGAMAELTPEQKDVAARLFSHLVTPSGTKIAHEVSDLADFGRVPEEELEPVLAKLADRRILRSLEEGGGVRYEIFHDVLAQPVLAWRTGHEADRELEQQQEVADRRHRRLLGVIGVGAVLLAAMGAVTVYALSQRTEARSQAREAKAHELEALATAQLERDPELGLLIGLEATRLSRSESAEKTLRDALLASRVRGFAPVGEPLLAAAIRQSDIVAVTKDGEVVVADPVTRAIRGRVSSGEPARSATFADDGTAVLTGRDGRARVVGLDRRVRTIPGVEDARAAVLSPDASRVAAIEEGGVRLIETDTGRTLEAYAHRGAISAAISRDNSRVATGGADANVHVWSGRSGRRVHTLTEHEGHAVALAFSPDGSFVASASTDGMGRMWRSSDWGLAAVLPGHTTALTDVGFSTDGDHVVLAGKDGTADVWNAQAGAPLFALAGHGDWVTSAAFSGGAGGSIVTASADGSARVWDGLFQPELEELARLSGPIRLVDVTNGRIHADTEDGRRHVLKTVSGDELGVERGSQRPREIVGPDGARATIRGKTVVLRRDGKTMVLEGHRDRVTSVSFSRRAGLVATASLDHDVRIWDAITGARLNVLQHNTAVHDARFSPDGRWLISAAFRAGLWNPRDGTLVVRLQGHEGTLTSAAFDESGRTIVTGGVDGTVRRYDCEICGGIDDLVALAEERIAATGRELTPEERARYLG